MNARALGYEVTVFAMVSLKSQAERDLSAFEELARSWPMVRECHMLNGEIDFILKCVAPNLLTFQDFLTGELTAAPNVSSVKTSLVIRSAKNEPGVPFEMSEHLVVGAGVRGAAAPSGHPTTISSGIRLSGSAPPSVTSEVRPSVIAVPVSESAMIMCRKNTMPGAMIVGAPS